MLAGFLGEGLIGIERQVIRPHRCVEECLGKAQQQKVQRQDGRAPDAQPQDSLFDLCHHHGLRSLRYFTMRRFNSSESKRPCDL